MIQRQSTLDDSPLAHLYQRHWLTLMINIRQHISLREDAEDVLLEVFLAALESDTLVNLNENQQLAWLRRVAYNKCVDYHRRVNRRHTVAIEETIENLYDEALAPEQAVLRQEAYSSLHQHIASLPELQQEVLYLRFAYGLHCKEIAQRMNKTDGAIRIMLSRTLNVLRNIYSKKPYEG